jgi:hypothetical protein
MSSIPEGTRARKAHATPRRNACDSLPANPGRETLDEGAAPD